MCFKQMICLCLQNNSQITLYHTYFKLKQDLAFGAIYCKILLIYLYKKSVLIKFLYILHVRVYVFIVFNLNFNKSDIAKN